MQLTPFPRRFCHRLSPQAGEDSTIVARRGKESVLVEAQLIEKGMKATWQTSIRANGEVKIAIIKIDRLRQFMNKHPEVELDVRACTSCSHKSDLLLDCSECQDADLRMTRN